VPAYDYVCSACHRLTEVVHGIEAEGPRFCPECGAEGTMKKVISAPNVHYKGTGWAKKDRGTSARAARAKDEKGSSTGDSTKSGVGSGSDSGSGGEKASSDAAKSEPKSSGGSSSDSASSGSTPSSSGSSD